MTDPDNAPENTDPKKNDDTAEQPTAAAEESDGTELSDEELGDAAGGIATEVQTGQANMVVQTRVTLGGVDPDPLNPASQRIHQEP